MASPALSSLKLDSGINWADEVESVATTPFSSTPRTAVSVAPTPSIGSATAGTPSGFSPATSFASAVSGVRVDARPALAGSASASLPSAMNAPAASSPLVTSAPRMRAGGDALAASANAPAFVPGALQVPSLSSPTQLSGLAPEYMPSGTTTARSSASALALTAPEFTPAGVAPSATPAATTAVPESLLAAAAAAAHGGDYRIIVRGILLPPNEPTRTAATTADVIGNWFYDRGVCPVDVLVPTAAGGLLAPTFDGTAILLFINASSAERAIALAGQRITPNVAPWPKLSLEQYHPVSLPIATGRFTAVSSSSPASNTSAPVSPKSGDIVQASSGSGVWAAAAAKVPATASSAGGSAVARVLQTGVTPPMSPSRATQTTAPNTPSSAPAARYALAARVGASQADDEIVSVNARPAAGIYSRNSRDVEGASDSASRSGFSRNGGFGSGFASGSHSYGGSSGSVDGPSQRSAFGGGRGRGGYQSARGTAFRGRGGSASGASLHDGPQDDGWERADPSRVRRGAAGARPADEEAATSSGQRGNIFSALNADDE